MKLLFILCCLLTASTTIAQNKRFKYAEKLYIGGAYADAAQGYEDVLARGFDSLKVANQISESYDRSGDILNALNWYAYQHNHSILDRKEYVRYSILLCTQEKYKESKKMLENCISTFGSDSVTDRLNNELEKFLSKTIKADNFEIVQQKGNSEFSEMSVIHLNNEKVLFASTRKQKVAVRRYHAINNKPLYDLFVANYDSTGFSKVRRFDENTKYHDASGTLDTLNQKFYFTRNNFIDGKPQKDSSGNMLLKIYVSDLVNDKLENTKECSFNSNAYSCAHPTISADGSKMYFASNMPGTIGGMDVFSVDIDSMGVFSKPINLGPEVNTVMDELFPFYHTKNDILFFASNGHYGYGGLDVYVAQIRKSKTVVENLGKPLNTPLDDFAFISNAIQKKGYVSSNRNGGVGDDDIYAFNQIKPYGSKTISGTTLDSLRKDTLSNVLVLLIDKNGVIVDSVYSDSLGYYSLDLSSIDDDFTIKAQKDKFELFSEKVQLNEEELEMKKDLKLIPILNYYIVGTVKEKETLNVLGDVKVTITNLRTSQTMYHLKTNYEGYFETDTIEEFKYNDPYAVSLLLEKKGYLTITYTLNDTLDLTERIDVNAFINPLMSKVNVGTDLAKLVDLNPIYYDYNKWDIRPDAAVELDKIVKVMMDNPNMKIELGSHTDSRGKMTKNQVLSDNRANAAVDYIISKGISKDRITAKGYGESKLLIPDSAFTKMKTVQEFEDAHQLNRRTEFRVISLK